MTRYPSLYGHFFKQNLKTQLEYRDSFIIGMLSTVAMQVAGLLTLWVVMRQVPLLRGWTLDQLLLIYGLITLSKSLNHMFADNLWRLGWAYIRTGDFDRYLVRPVNPLFHLLADRFCQDGVGNFIVGLALLIHSSLELGIPWTLQSGLYTLISVLAGGLIFLGINLITSSLSFWMVDSLPVMWGTFETHEFAKYPLNIYGQGISLIFTWILPFALASFYPASYLLGKDVGLLAWVSPGVAAALLALGYLLWSAGLRQYSSSGS